MSEEAARGRHATRTHRAGEEALVAVLRLQAEPTAPVLRRRACLVLTVLGLALAAGLSLRTIQAVHVFLAASNGK